MQKRKTKPMMNCHSNVKWLIADARWHN